MSRALGIAVAVFLQLSLTLEAQSAWAQLESGARIRVTASNSSPARRTGSFVSLDGDSLRYTAAAADSIVTLPLGSVARLERSTGRHSGAGRGAAIGGLIGGGLGLALGLAASSEENSFYEVGGEDVAVVTVLLGAVGAGVGALIGSGSKRDRWETVSLTVKP
jgi:hypothetical protein